MLWLRSLRSLSRIPRGSSTYVSCVRFDAQLEEQGAELRCEPLAFCLLVS